MICKTFTHKSNPARLLFDDFCYQMPQRQPHKHINCFPWKNNIVRKCWTYGPIPTWWQIYYAFAMPWSLCYSAERLNADIFFLLCFCTQKWHKFFYINRSLQSKHSTVWAEGRIWFSLFLPFEAKRLIKSLWLSLCDSVTLVRLGNFSTCRFNWRRDEVASNWPLTSNYGHRHFHNCERAAWRSAGGGCRTFLSLSESSSVQVSVPLVDQVPIVIGFALLVSSQSRSALKRSWSWNNLRPGQSFLPVCGCVWYPSPPFLIALARGDWGESECAYRCFSTDPCLLEIALI